MKKEELLALSNMIRERAESDYYGKEPSTESVLRDLNYVLKPVLTHAEWKDGIDSVLEDCMRMAASLGSWTRTESKTSQAIARSAFNEIKKEGTLLVIRAVAVPHDKEVAT